MKKSKAFSSVAIVVATILGGLNSASHAAQCGNGPGGFEAWKQQIAGEAKAKGIGAAGISALMSTNYAGATIAADRGQHSEVLAFRSINFSPSAAPPPSWHAGVP
jgi:membrane-bound lytic murein transglycosylase B